ncbi:MAG TPA: phosphomethylpyrimidine synthase ThiC [Acidobacteriota bacterium]|jgi:phosphomethylpyrimidine synthase|nr:phosphomethylpyrimidine synthase ThiC [Acidobacteriota bacterium]
MSTQLIFAKEGTITEEMKMVAEDEGLDPEIIRQGVARGEIVIPKNINHHFRPRGIGKGLSTKVNANIGHSSDHQDEDEELHKLNVCVETLADAVMDLSTGDDLDRMRIKMVQNSPLMLGTVPIYAVARGNSIIKWTPDELFEEIEKQGQQGVDYITVHCGVTRESVSRLEDSPRVEGIVSRGGSIHAHWIRFNNAENPLYEQFDRLLEICKKYDMTLSLGDGLRPGAIEDSTDRPQLQELIIIGQLQRRAHEAGVQAMIEGPGHVPLDQIAYNMQIEKRLCNNAPFYVLGPLPIDIGAGYDHIVGAIGGAVASSAGADMLCYVTPAEHLRLPTVDDVRDGIVAFKIAAACGDVSKGVKGARERNFEMSRARKLLDWEGMYRLGLYGAKAREMRKQSEDYDSAVCTMCGTLCAVNIDNATIRQTGRNELLQIGNITS